MQFSSENDRLPRLKTGIRGFDQISNGGIPLGRSTIVAGTAGSSKTIFACQFLSAGIENFDESGVFVTFEETPQDIRENMAGFGWDIEKWEEEKKWAFVDASFDPSFQINIGGDFDFGALLVRIENAVKITGAKRVSIDSVGAIFTQFTDVSIVRRELFRISRALREMNVTVVLTLERIHEYGDISRFGVEEFVADNVIILRNVLDQEKRRRTVEILKFRGASHRKGEYPFTITPKDGIIGLPLSEIGLDQKSSDTRITSGVPELDKMCGDGFFRDSVLLVSGATGTGKTLLTTHFIAGGAATGEKCLLLAFEESREQLIRNAQGWGVDFLGMEKEGKLKVICQYPEVSNLEDHLLSIRDSIDEFKPDRVAIDSLSALERVSSERGFREFVIGVTSIIKDNEITGMFTSTTPSLMGGTSITEAHISTITDSIILLRYVEIYGKMRRGLTVLKMRGSMHEKDIREYSIGEKGMTLEKSFQNIGGILAGNPVQLVPQEIERIESMFGDEEPPTVN